MSYFFNLLKRGKGRVKKKLTVSSSSGAGKTVSAKYIMRYFATADDQELQGKKQKAGMTEVEEQILGMIAERMKQKSEC